MLALAGCSPSPTVTASGTEYSRHTLQELCDFSKAFFIDQFAVNTIETDLTLSMPIENEIEAGNGCSYYTPKEWGRGYLGMASIWQNRDYLSLSTAEGAPARHIDVDGSAVALYIDPVPQNADPETVRPAYTLNVVIDGWGGELTFEGGTEAGAQVGAATLVKMVRALKS
ncbi:hypothetical protein [Nocardia farcinica]|uniref:hypothetical protein n=1 Tax=Nocardia farcinica TaxID=37329 RepID=UPI001E3AE145|nr:hypothetical protein [Nocardia farcinica]